VAALDWALTTTRPEIFNTDQGAQFTSEVFTNRLEKQDITISMDGRGRAIDNIFIERLWRTVKYEEVYLKDYGDVLEAVAPQLILLACYRPPQALFGIWHKAQSQFASHEPFYRAFGIDEIPLASPSAAIGLRLRQMQRSGLAACAFPLLAERFPVPFQCSPHWFPILRRRFPPWPFAVRGVAAELTRRFM
jgi:transposase InsO family protein